LTSQWTYTLTHYDESNSWASTVITDDVVSIPLVTDTGSGEVNSARIILSANEGKFIKSAPVIDEFDRIRIQIDDGDSSTTNYDRYFEVSKILPSESKSEGTRLELFLLGLEHNLQIINYIKPHYNAGTYEVMEDIGNQYMDSKGTKQPDLTGHDSTTYNKLPNSSFQRNNYEFGSNESPCYDRMGEIVDSLGASVENGGALDFYDFKFTNSAVTNMTLKVFSSGNNIADGSQKIISDSTSVNVGETESGIDNKSGTVVLAWGEAESGTVPYSNSQFASEEIRYNLYPIWDVTTEYKIGAKVQYQGILYKRVNTDVSLPPQLPTADSNWVSQTKDQDYGAVYQYSPFTDNRDGEWKDNAINILDANQGVSQALGIGFNDANMIVWDTASNWFRTWADVKVTDATPNPSDISNDSTLSKYLYGGDTFYRGFRVLITQNVTSSSGKWWSDNNGASGGTDRNGKSFSKAIVECVTPGTATNAEWVVKYEGGSSNDDLACVVRHDGIAQQNDSGTWTGLGYESGVFNGIKDTDYWHPFEAITEVEGVYQPASGTNYNSAIKVSTEWQTILGAIITEQEKHQAGGWLNFNFPFPHCKQNGVLDVGNLFGGNKTGRDVVCEPATLDVENMHITRQGMRGFNATVEEGVEEFGQISSIDFMFMLDYQAKIASGDSWKPTTEPNIPISVIIVDTSDNMVKQDFSVPFQRQFLPYKLPISGFQTYRARKPKETAIDTIVPPKEIQMNNQIEWRNIKQIIFQTTTSYDDQGRYCVGADTGNWWANREVKLELSGGFPLPGYGYRKLDMSIDAFRFTKPLLVTSGPDTDKDIEAEFLERPETSDYFALKGMAEAERQKRDFRHVEYEVNTTGLFDIEMGDFFKFKHPRLISDGLRSGTDGGINYIKLVAKRIEYSITKPVDGKGGFLRKILGVRRFE